MYITCWTSTQLQIPSNILILSLFCTTSCLNNLSIGKLQVLMPFNAYLCESSFNFTICARVLSKQWEQLIMRYSIIHITTCYHYLCIYIKNLCYVTMVATTYKIVQFIFHFFVRSIHLSNVETNIAFQRQLKNIILLYFLRHIPGNYIRLIKIFTCDCEAVVTQRVSASKKHPCKYIKH